MARAAEKMDYVISFSRRDGADVQVYSLHHEISNRLQLLLRLLLRHVVSTIKAPLQ